jgi:hypothetical protein
LSQKRQFFRQFFFGQKLKKNQNIVPRYSRLVGKSGLGILEKLPAGSRPLFATLPVQPASDAYRGNFLQAMQV